MPDLYYLRTKSAFMWSRILGTPLWAIYSLLPFILYRDLGATPLQIAIIVALKPALSLLSIYWSSLIKNRSDRLMSNVIWASIIRVIPFLFFPFINNVWYFIFASGFFIMFHRGVNPAWMELMKQNLPGDSRGRIFAWGSAVGYLGDAILPFMFGWMMDDYLEPWRWIFPTTALISILSVFFQYRITIRLSPIKTPSKENQLLRPWKDAWELICRRPDFRGFQIGFMLSGGGLMMMHAVLPAFFMGSLELTYTELGIALALCKGIGYVLTSQMWARWMDNIDIYSFSALVTVFAALFSFVLLISPFNISYLYIAYIIYGVMQAGSELSWNLSGPIFSKNEDSSVYSSVNIFTVGLRGCFAPAIGTMLLAFSSPAAVLLISGLLSLLATTSMRTQKARALLENQA